MAHLTSTQTKTDEITSSKNSEGLKLFLSFFRRNKRLMTTAIVLMVINIFLILLPAVLVGRSLDLLLELGYSSEYIKSILLIVFVAIITYFTSAVSSYSFSLTAFATERDVRNEFFESLIDSSQQFHDRNSSSELLSLGINEIHFLAAGSMMTGIIMRSLISVSMVLYYIYPYIGLTPLIVSTTTFIIYFIYVYIYAKRVVPVRRSASITLGSLTRQSQEIFQGIEVIRSMTSEKKEIDRFKKINFENTQFNEQEGKLRAFYVPGLVMLIAISYIFAIGVFNVSNGLITITQLVEIIGLLIILQTVNFTIPNIVLAIRGGILNAERIASKIGEAKEMKMEEEEQNASIENIDIIEFDNVTFAYPVAWKAVIKQMSFKITKGQKVVLLGGPGSGKSTIMKLILGLYRPQHGTVKINGKPVQQFDQTLLRKKIAMVEQEVFLFKSSIRDNIRFANKSASEAQIQTAAAYAQALEFIESFDQGFDTVIGERGVTLSGGQRQRLAIARALMTHPQLLLLDDSTSALDAKTEKMILNSLHEITDNMTTISIAHRINVIEEADVIIFLDKGQIIGIGNHDELYETNEKYKWMFDLLPDESKMDNMVMMEEN